ncbi:MAG: CSLREA domain-containing protein [Anaerolineaceae bacterium]|nr:CSLREA domain-containing protein [Anaerolineaceae bacterium]
MKMKKNITFSIVIIFLEMCALLSTPHQLVMAETITVTKFTDSNGDCMPTDCSLREAIKKANETSNPDTISLKEGTYTLTMDELDPLFIFSPLTVIGAGPSKTIIDASVVSNGVFKIDVAALLQSPN